MNLAGSVLGHTDWVTVVAVFPLESQPLALVTGSRDKTLILWSWAEAYQQYKVLQGFYYADKEATRTSFPALL
jgi:WD40 repeat protein